MQLPKIRLVTPGRILLYVFLLLLLVSYAGSILLGMASHLDLTTTSISESEVDAQLHAIKRKTRAGEDDLQVIIFPEGALFTNVFYGYSLVNIGLNRPGDKAFTQDSLSELQRIIEKIKTYKDKTPFNTTKDKFLPGGIIYAGNLNRLRAGYILLGGKNAEIVSEFHTDIGKIAEAFSRVTAPIPESYLDYYAPVDGVCALDALRLHDELFGSDYSRIRLRWLNWMKTHLDPESGSMITQSSKGSDTIIEGSRGWSVAWLLAIMPGLDQKFALEQYRIFHDEWVHPFGLGWAGIDEWYKGREKPTTVKVGIVVGSLGAGSSGLGIAAARANADYASWHKILRSLESFTAPFYSCYSGEKTYMFGQGLMCDTVALWGKTIINWKAPSPSSIPVTKGGDPFGMAIGAYASIFLLASLFLLHHIIRMMKSKDYMRPAITQTMVIAGIIQLSLALVGLCCPLVGWMQIVMLMAITDLMEELCIRPTIVARLYREQETKSNS